MKTLEDLPIQEGSRVLVRLDVNVPITDGIIHDDFRIAESVPTIRYLAQKKAKCVVVGHLGRPDGKAQKEFSLQPIAKRLGELLGKGVRFIEEPIGETLHKHIEQMKPGEVILLENIRFYPGEEQNDETFAKQLAQLADFYVNDAFGACHRAHASIAGVAKHLPSAAGLLLQKEVEVLAQIRERPEKPMIVIVGGTKVETKASFLAHISKNADAILLGNLISREAKEKGLQVAPSAEIVYAEDSIPGNGEEFDIGPQTLELFLSKLKGSRTVFWAGPLGKIEEEQYEKGSLAIANAILQSGAYAVAGGGDLAAFLNKHNLREKFAHVSTGGGAMLAFLAGEELPGLKALEFQV